ncbi:MAG: hypothetical protein LC620_08715, partial [Halobacteriales archaeon]|nr:hypothetical protein [Halobacteriales archaeon]
MSRRLWPPVLIVLLLASASLAAYWGIPRTPLSRDPNEVDHVSLYQNGLAAISLVRPFDSTGGSQVLTLSLPTTTIFDSLTVTGDGVAVRELRSSLSADPALHPGDRLLVRTDDGSTISGTFLAQEDDQLMLAKEDGTAVVRFAHITAVEVSGRTIAPGGPGSTSVSILVSAPAGHHVVRVAYLAQGVGWNPNYILDPDTGAMTFFATLTGLQDWANVTLDLVAGNPNMVYTPQTYAPRLEYAGMGGAMDLASTSTYAPPVGGSETLGAMHRYHYEGT